MIATNRVGVFGGSFDPIHFGHIHLLNEISALQIFSTLLVIPAGDPWQKNPNVHALLRLEMVRAALQDLAVEVSDLEVTRPGKTYAIDTVRELRKRFPVEQLTWIIGSDVVSNLATWHQIEELAKQIDFLVITRPNNQLAKSEIPEFIKYTEMEIAALDISATQVRSSLANGNDVSQLIPDSVLQIIKSKGLYGAA